MGGLCNSYIALDVETTGLRVKEDRIIEIAAVKVIEGREVACFNTLINPHMRLSEYTRDITGIEEEQLLDKPGIEDVMPEFFEFIEELPLLGHRILFDYSFIKKAAVNLGIEFNKEGIDTLELSRLCLPKEQSKVLKEACKFMNIDMKDWHRALPDARASHSLYQALKLRFADCLADKKIKKELKFKIKREQKASRTQKEHLQNILNCHKITLEIDIDTLSKNQISRIIDKIRFNKVYIDRERK